MWWHRTAVGGRRPFISFFPPSTGSTPPPVAVGFSRVFWPRTNKNARRRPWDWCFTARSGQISSFPLCVPVVCACVCFSCLADSPQLGSLCVLIPSLPESPGGPSSFPTFFFFPFLQASPLLSVSSCAPHPRPPLPSPSHAEAHSRRASNNARVQAHPPTFSALCLLSLSPAWLCAAATKPWGQPMRSLSTGELQA